MPTTTRLAKSQDRMSALVSVVVPTRNRADMLVRALQSVLAQTYSRLEVIVVDDASSDDTRAVVLALQDDRIRYVRHETNRGGSAARNTGVRHASGDYIAFLDDDDEWDAPKTAMQLACLRGFDAVMCTAYINGKDMAERRPRRTVDAGILRKRMFPYGGIGVLMARAQVLREIAFDETLPKCQDWDLVIRIAAKYRIRYLNKSLLRFNDGAHPRISNQITHLSTEDLMRKYRVFFDKHQRFFGKRWVRFHLAGMLLYGLRHRDARIKRVIEAVRLCGAIAVSRVLVKRLRQLTAERVPRPHASPALDERAAARATG